VGLARLLFMMLSMRVHEIPEWLMIMFDDLDGWGMVWRLVILRLRDLREMIERSGLLQLLCVLNQMISTIYIQLFPENRK
jgi:hypothetical protein